jgi:hypothetical protein
MANQATPASERAAGSFCVLRARLPGRAAIADGARAHLTSDPADPHLFDAGTGWRLHSVPQPV